MGHNLEPSELGAAFGLVQLKKLDQNIRIREKNFNKIYNFLKKYEEIFILPQQLKDTKTAWLAFPITLRSNAPFSRTEMQIFLEKNNIQTRVIFTGNILRQPGFKNIKFGGGRYFPEADKVMKYGILIGCHQGINNKKMNYMLKKLETFIKSKIN